MKNSFKKIVSHNSLGGVIVERDALNGLYKETLNAFATEVVETRTGVKKDSLGGTIPAFDISFADAISFSYGIVAPGKNEDGVVMTAKDKSMFVIKQFLKQNDISFSTDTLASTAKKFGNSNLTKSGVEKLMVGHSELSALNNTQQIDGGFRFIIPELILAAIKIDFEADAMYSKWTAGTINVTGNKVTMPQILRGNAIPKKIGEAESIPFGTVRFGQKEASIFKVGVGFKITDELLQNSSLDMLFQFLGEVGSDMSIGADVEAFNILMNGEQGDGSESAPVIGVSTVNSFLFKDLKLGIGRMRRLKRNVSRIITSETDAISLGEFDEFKGFAGDTKAGKLNSILGAPPTLENDIWAQPDGQVLLVDPANAMVELKRNSMKTETRRNPQNQEDEVFVSMELGFAIKRRDGRLLIDKTQAFAGFPEYMDIDARINQAFKHKNQ